MKRAFSLLVLIAAVSICPSQPKTPSAWPDLRKYSSDQLKACYNDKSICGTDNVDAITDERERRLPEFSTEELVNCSSDWKVCGVGNDLSTGWVVSEEVSRRSNAHRLLVRYWSEPDDNVRYGILHVAYHLKSPEATAFMKRVLSVGRGDDDDLYWPADYLAKRCDSGALKWLSSTPRPARGMHRLGTDRCALRQVPLSASNSVPGREFSRRCLSQHRGCRGTRPPRDVSSKPEGFQQH